MASNTNLGNTPVSQGYTQLFHTGETGGLTSTLQQVFDGDGTGSDLYLATNKVKIGTAGNFLIGSSTIQEYIQDIVGAMFDTNGSHTNITATYDDDGDGAIDLNATGAIASIIQGTGITTSGTSNITINVDTTTIATRSYVDTEVAGLVDSAPATLDTLNELASALGDDPNFATSTSTSLGNRLRVDISTQGLTTLQQENAIDNLGITASQAELNYVDGVTSNIQTQLNGKLVASNNLSDLTSASTARTNLGLGTGAVLDTAGVSDGATTLATGNAIYDHVTARISGKVDTSGSPVAQEYARFTDSNTIEGRSYSEVRSDLGLAIGSDVQAYDDNLQDIASINEGVLGLNDTDKFIGWSGSSASFVISSFPATQMSGSTNNGLLTYNSASVASVESNLTFDGTTYLQIKSSDGVEGGLRLSKSTTDATHTTYHISHRDDNQSLWIYSYDGTTYRNWLQLDEPNALLKLGSNSSALSSFNSDGDLDMYGDIEISATNKLYFDGGNGTYVHELSDNVIEFRTDNNPVLKIDNLAGVIVNDASYSSFDFRVESNDNTHMLFVDSGANNIAIGTTSADATLHIGDNSSNFDLGDTSGDTLDLLKLESKTDNASQLIFRQLREADGSSWTTSGTRILARTDVTEQSYIQFNGNGNQYGLSFGVGTSSEAMRIINGGNVGIGVTNPSRPLQIGSTTTNGEAIKLDGNASYGASIYYSRGGGYNWNAGVGGASSSSSNIPASYWGIEDVSQSNAVRFCIAHTTGNVGIGVTNPSRKLQVAGAIELSTADTTIDTNNFTLRRGSSGEGFLDAPGNIQINIDTNNNQSDAFFAVAKDAINTPLFKVLESGAITFNNAYTFPTSDGTAGQYLFTNGSGTLSFQDLDVDYTDLGSGSLGAGDTNKTLIFNGSNATWEVNYPSSTMFSAGTNVNNRLITATGATNGVTLNGESNLTFDGSTLALSGDLNVGSGDFFVDDSAGRVGVGTTNPGYKLSVENELNVFSSGDTASPKIEGHLLRVTNTTDNNGVIEHFFVENDGLNYGMRWVYDGATNNDFRLYRHNNDVSGTEVLRFSRTNNNIYAPGSLRVNGVGIGIGNSAPQNTLHVDATTSSNVVARFNTDSTYTFIDLYNDDLNRVQIGNADDGDFIIRTNDAERFRINSSGLIKVGPNGGDTTNVFEIDTSGNTQHGLMINADQARGAGRYALLVDDEDPNSRGSVVIQTASGPSLTTTGSVGIGITSPSRLLDVGGDINLSGILYMDNSILIDTNRRFRNVNSSVGADLTGGTHRVDFATPDTPGSTGWYTICKASSANARGGGIININATGGSITPTTITIDFFVDWSGNLTRCNTQGVSSQFTKVRLIETASTTELQIYVNTSVAQAVYVSFEQDRYNPNYSLLDPWATATPTTTGDEILLRNTSVYANGANTSTLVVSDSARRLLLGRDSIQSTDLTGSATQLFINSNTTFSGQVNIGGALTGVTGLYGASSALTMYNDIYSFKTASSAQLGYWNSTGLGIGTLSPSAKLEVNGTSNFTGEMYIDHGGSGYSPGISFMGGTNIPGSNTYENAQLAYYDNAGTGYFRSRIARWGGDFRWIIGDSGGDVTCATLSKTGLGIGTTAPSQKLHTNGTAADTRTRTSTSNHGTYFESGVTADSAGILLVAGHASSILNVYLQGAGGTQNQFRFTHNGDFLADEDIIAYSTSVGSDIKLKKNVKDISYGLNDVLKMRAVEFDWKEKRQGKHDIGFIAQEIEKIIPEVVQEVNTLKTDGDTHKVVDYAKLTSVLIKAIQEQQQQINELREKLNG